MSVTPDDAARLPPHVRPASLPGGRGKLPVFSLQSAFLGGSLEIRRDPAHPDRHAFVEPARTMGLVEFQTALGFTRDYWQEV
jgi:hypothetical protein